MTQEEKAKAYDKVREKIALRFCSNVADEIFSQFEMSEDKKIRKQIKAFIKSRGSYITQSKTDAWITWLEKQGEQKPVEYSLEQAAHIFLEALSSTPYNNKPITDAQCVTRELLKFLSDASTYNPDALNEQKPAEVRTTGYWNVQEVEQNPADKVEPKFKVGDKVECIESFDGFIKGLIYTCKEDGWVGCDRQGDWTSKLDKFKAIPSNGGFWEGYNAAKRELEQKPAWSEEDEEHLNSIISDIKTDMGAYPRSQEVIDIYNDDISFLKSLKDRVQLKQEWSEEDKNKVTLFMQLTEGCDNEEELADWLKSLKDRVQPQPQQEWSDEEIENCAREAEDNNCIILAKHIRKLKSLRPQNKWKPSDEQMEALEHFIVYHNGSTNYAKDLEELRLQLKKLREK